MFLEVDPIFGLTPVSLFLGIVVVVVAVWAIKKLLS